MHLWRKCFKLEIPQFFFLFLTSSGPLCNCCWLFSRFLNRRNNKNFCKSFSFIFSRFLILKSHLKDKACSLNTLQNIYIVLFEGHETKMPTLLSLYPSRFDIRLLISFRQPIFAITQRLLNVYDTK